MPSTAVSSDAPSTAEGSAAQAGSPVVRSEMRRRLGQQRDATAAMTGDQDDDERRGDQRAEGGAERLARGRAAGRLVAGRRQRRLSAEQQRHSRTA